MYIKKVNLFHGYEGAIYNAAAWIEDGNIHLLAREVLRAGERGLPDIGDLVLFKLDDECEIKSRQIVWKPEEGKGVLEDPRVLHWYENKLVIGLTYVDKTSEGYLPYPSIIFTDVENIAEDLNNIEPIRNFGPGKNATPLSHHTFIFRKDDVENHHKLHVYRWSEEGELYELQTLQIPTDLSWAQWRGGTGTTPLWLDHDAAVMIIHGITITDDKYIYSLGRAILRRDGERFKFEVHPEPILTPDDFLDEKGQPLIGELHPHLRRVVYTTGGIVKDKEGEKTLSLFVNVGDKTTYEVTYKLSELL